MVMLHTLNNMSIEEKDSKVKHFIALGGPFLGAPMALSIMLGGFTDFMYPLGLGFHLNG